MPPALTHPPFHYAKKEREAMNALNEDFEELEIGISVLTLDKDTVNTTPGPAHTHIISGHDE